VAAVAFSILVLTLGGHLLALLPKAALAGLMLVVALSLVDPWSRSMLRQSRDAGRRAVLAPALLTMALVTLATAAFGPGTGVAVGVALSVTMFVRRVRGRTVRWRGTAEARPSRRVYPDGLEQSLQPLRRQVRVLELEGTLFWGNAERAADEAEAVPEGTRFVVLDLHRVSSVDESAAVELTQLSHRLAERGVALLPAGQAGAATEGRTWGEHLAEAAGSPPLPSWPDADRAVEHAELALLAEHCDMPDLLGSPVLLEHTGLLSGLSDVQQQALRRQLQPRRLQAGEALFHAGDEADALYVLTRGSVTVALPGATRFISFSPGTMLGELALLDGGGRSADAVADQEAEVHALTRDALARLAAENPALAAQVYQRLAAHLAERLRVASAAWRDAAA